MSPSVLEGLRAAKASGGRAILLVPSLAQALSAQEALAAEPGLALGVTASTPSVWAEERWGLYGDGRVVVDDATRALLMGEILASAPQDLRHPLDDGAGTCDFLADVAKTSLAWMPFSSAGAVDEEALETLRLQGAEVSVVRMLSLYASRLAAIARVEPCCMELSLPPLMDEGGCPRDGVVMAGFSSMDPALRAMAARLASVRELTVIMRMGDGPAFEQERALAETLASDAERASVAVCFEDDESQTKPGCVDELACLSSTLFRVGEPGIGLVRSEGAARLVLPAGPVAEGEAIAGEVARLACEGSTDIVLVSPDARASFSVLAPKLRSRGISLKAQMGCSVGETTVGSAFLSFASCVFSLAAAALDWPEDGSLGPMGWWPPVGATDFLLSVLSGAGGEVAWRLDKSWRANRRLTPMTVLGDLVNRKNVPETTVAAVNALRKGYVGTAARQLELGLADRLPGRCEGDFACTEDGEGDSAILEALAVLRSVEGVTQVVRDVSRAQGRAADERIDQATFDRILRVISNAYVPMRLETGVDASRAVVRLMTLGQAASLDPSSADAVILQGLTTANYPLRDADDAATALMERLGMTGVRRDSLMTSRMSLHRVVRVARSRLSVERVTHDAAGDDAYPSVMATELVSCFGDSGGSKPEAGDVLPRSIRGESAVGENLSASGVAPAATDGELPAQAGSIDPSLSDLIVIPRIHGSQVFDDVLSLSATQIECYLECPYKWFSLKRMGLRGLDAGCGPVEAGLFAHGALEELHRAIIEEGEQGMGPGRVTPDTLAHANELLDEVISRRCDSKANELIAHTVGEERQVDYIRRDLSKLLRYEATRLEGFRPALLEQAFGIVQEHSCTYAGCSFEGAIDRVDVDERGQAIVIDYKNRSRSSVYNEYRLFKDGIPKEFTLPRHVQALIYAQVVRKSFDLDVVGALYFGTKGDPILMGSLSDAAFDRTSAISTNLRDQCVVPVPAIGIDRFSDLLDRTEGLIAEKIDRLKAGDVEADPVDADACTWCPVMVCERRLS